MMELIKIEEKNGKKAVNARELHEFLGSKRNFSDWIKDRIRKYGFTENQDYTSLSQICENGGRSIEYALTLDCAKEISMVEGNEKGKIARKYFIDCERRANEFSKKFDIQDILGNVEVTIAMLKEYQKEKVKSIELEQKLEYALPKAEMAERAIELGGLVDVGEAAKLLGLQLGGRNNLYQALREDGYFFLNKNKNEPLQKWIKKGWFELKEKGNKEGMKPGSYVTQQGLFELSRLYNGKKDLSYMRPNNTKDRDISKFQLSIKFEY